MNPIIITAFYCACAVAAGVFEGNGAVYCFNRMPAGWLCDYGQKPPKELTDPYTQRIRSMPWKYIFTMLFIVLNIRLVTEDPVFALAASAAIWVLLELSIADIKYRIVPDQLLIMLAVTGMGMISYQSSWRDAAFGAVAGFGIMGAVALLGRAIYRSEAVGGGDIKLVAVLGFLCGTSGIIVVFAVASFLSSAHFVILLVRKKIKKSDHMAMVPYFAFAASAYIVFFWGKWEFLAL